MGDCQWSMVFEAADRQQESGNRKLLGCCIFPQFPQLPQRRNEEKAEKFFIKR
jgi:hypothetical protein